MKIIKTTGREIEKIVARSSGRKQRIEDKVRKIIREVQARGDDALIRYTEKFDKIKLTPAKLKVTEQEINGAYQHIKPEFINSLKIAIENVSHFYKRRNLKSLRRRKEDGIVLGERIMPLETVGIYIPAGTAPLVSTVYMTVMPARIAGVKKIVIVSPPNKYGTIDEHILAVAKLLKVDEMYKVGGAQAIAALAFGTRTIPRVDKIVGPGNEYVTEAKRQVFGYVDVDMVAGPSEVVIIANQFTNPQFVISDLKAQAEHHQGLSILITPSKRLARAVKSVMAKEKGYIIMVNNLNEAVRITDRIAPEHLQIMVKSPSKILKRVKSAGAVFVGQYSPTAVGDYVAGPSHVLPTGGSARYFSGLGVEDFVKRMHIISYSKKALEKVLTPVEKIAGIEGLNHHYESVRVRIVKEE